MEDEEIHNGGEFRENNTNIKELIYINDYEGISSAENNEIPKREILSYMSHQNKIKNNVFPTYENVNYTSLTMKIQLLI